MTCTTTTRSELRARIRAWVTLLLLGIVVNLLVSWSLLLIPRWSDAADLRVIQQRTANTEHQYPATFSAIHQWLGVHEHQFYLTQRSRSRPVPMRSRIFWTWLPWDQDPDPVTRANELFAMFAPEHPDNAVVSTTRVGFPALTLQTHTLVEDFAFLPNGALPTQSRNGFLERIDGLAGATKPPIFSHAQFTLFPYQPIWIGFAINTVFYTLVALAFTWSIRQFKHARRMRRGRCPFCAYELHHDFRDGCSECGWRRDTASSDP